MTGNALERLISLRPWDNVGEEDFYRVNGLWISIRGNTRQPEGAWCTAHRAQAERWILEPDAGPGDGCSYDASTKVVSGAHEEQAEEALSRVLDHFEGKPSDGVEFPVFLNPASKTGESLPRG